MRRSRWVLIPVFACGLGPAGPPDPRRAAPDSPPVLSRDGKRVFFISNRDGLPQVYAGEVERSEALPARVVRTTEVAAGPRPRPDGKSPE